MFERISDILPRLDLYIRMFLNSQKLIKGIARIYSDISGFCISARKVFSEEVGNSHKKCELRAGRVKDQDAKKPSISVRLGTSSETALKLIRVDFEGQLGKILDDICEHEISVEDEATAAAMEDGQFRLQNLETQNKGSVFSRTVDLFGTGTENNFTNPRIEHQLK